MVCTCQHILNFGSFLLDFLNILAIIEISFDPFRNSSARCPPKAKATDETWKVGKTGYYIELVVKARLIVAL